MQLWPDAAPGKPQVGCGHHRQQFASCVRKRLDWQTVVLVVVLPLLVLHRRTEPDIASRRAGHMNAKPMPSGVRQWIDQRIYQRTFGGNQLRIFAADGVDRELVAST